MRRTTRSERAATSVEYALLVGLIAVVIFLAVGTLGTSLSGLFGAPCEELAKAGSPC